MEVIGIILFCLISIWLGVGSSWLIICESRSYKPKPSIREEEELDLMYSFCPEYGQRLDWRVEE